MKKKKDYKRLVLWLLVAWCSLLTYAGIWLFGKIIMLAEVCVRIVELIQVLIQGTGLWT